MNAIHLDRPLGLTDPWILQRAETARRIDAIAFAPHIQFDGGYEPGEIEATAGSPSSQQYWAHKAGAQYMVIDRFDGRYALSGGTDASIQLWDLEQAGDSSNALIHKPLETVTRGPHAHKYGITGISFYPSDPGLFVTSSYDHHVNVYDTNTLEVSASFNLASKVYSNHMSPIATNVLVATASQHPAIRLIDLRSGSTLHSMVGHNGAVMTVAWSPKEEHLLASGGSDGTLRLWDIRRSASCLGLFDLEDSAGTLGIDGAGTGARNPFSGKAHIGGCNGLSWTEDGQHIVSTGHDERIRLWNVASGANELSHFGPQVRNKNHSTVLPLPLPRPQTSPGRSLMFYPNEREILLFDLFDGTLLKRLRSPGAAIGQGKKTIGQRNVISRCTSLAWRRDHLELYSTHSDGHIRAWCPKLVDDADLEEDDAKGMHDDQEAKKRKALDDIFQSLTKKPITFT